MPPAAYGTNDRPAPGEYDDVRGVIEHVRRLDVAAQITELKIGRRGEHRAELAFDTDEAIEIERDRRAESVVAEARFVVLRSKICGTSRHIRHFDQSRRVSSLPVRARFQRLTRFPR